MTTRSRYADRALFVALVLAAIGVALALGGGILALAGKPAAAAYDAILQGSVGSTAALVTTLNHAAPILIVAVGAAIAGRAAIVNIGQEGQVLVGATVGVVVGTTVTGPSLVVVPLVLLSAALGGAVWSGFAALLRYAARVNEVVSTLLLNFVAVAGVSYLVNQPSLLQETLPEGSVQAASPQSDPIDAAARLPILMSGSGFRLHAGIAIAVVLALVASVAITRTQWGFRLRMFGLNPRTARRVGVRATAMGASALVLSGAFAGLAGGVILTGTAMRVNPGVANNYGWEGLLVALVAGYNTIAAIGAALLFGALRAGGGVLASTGVDSSIVAVIQALIVLAVMLPALFMAHRRRRAAAAAARLALQDDEPGRVELEVVA